MKENKDSNLPSIEISLLGRFGAKIDGVPIDEKRWSRSSAKSLVKLLALKPFHTLHREQIMDLLWLEQTPETALNNLNKAIYGARRAFEPDLEKGSASQFLVTQKNQIVLSSPGMLRIDLDEFERLANLALQNNDIDAGQKALEIYQGDLLTEDIYEDWIYSRRETLRLLFRKTATKTAALYAAGNDRTASIEILKKLSCDDPSDEYVQRLLMRLYAETGSKYQAIKQFEQCRDSLRALGIEPESETIKIEQSIKRGEILPVANEIKATPTIPVIAAPRIRQLTFQNGLVRTPRFLPGGQSIVFSAAWNGNAAELYSMPLDTGEMHCLDTENAEVFSVSTAGEIAVALQPKFEGYFNSSVLGKLTLNNRPTHEILDGVHWADWHPARKDENSLPDEQCLAVVCERDKKTYLEYPVGNVIFETAGWIGHPRFSNDGRKIAFIEHPLHYDDRGYVSVIDLESKEHRRLTENMPSVQGLAWSNDEIWFTGSREGPARMINAIDHKGKERLIYRGTGRLTIHDVSASGAVLVTDDSVRIQAVGGGAGEEIERNLSWHDWTLVRDLTDDGETLLFEEAGFSGGSELTTYIRKTDGSAPRKLGNCSAAAFSPDNQFALLRYLTPHHQLAFVPLGEGEIKLLENDPDDRLAYEVYVDFFPDGKRIIFTATGSSGRRVYVQNIDGGKPVPFTSDEGVTMGSLHSISTAGRYVVLTDSEHRLRLYQTSDGTSTPLKNLEKDFWMIRWADDGENLFVWKRDGLPAVVYKYNPVSGTKEEWLTLMPKDPLANQMVGIKLSPDGKTYAYSYIRESSELFLMEVIK
ncbi:MAG: PD40 domain-containing protein [Acidobacteria bacterium]|nr:PD40 domain-containing protein [Acidobacteriota bacterium]